MLTVGLSSQVYITEFHWTVPSCHLENTCYKKNNSYSLALLSRHAILVPVNKSGPVRLAQNLTYVPQGVRLLTQYSQ